MATVPSEVTAVAGSVLTAAMWNSNVRDGLNFILSPPFAVLRQTVAQSLATSGSWTSILLDTEDIDRDNGHSTSSNTSRYTSQTAGWYDCDGYAATAANSTNARGTRLAVNGNASRGRATFGPATASDIWGGPCVGSVYLNVGDYVEVQAFQNTGGALNTAVPGDVTSALTVRWCST